MNSASTLIVLGYIIVCGYAQYYLDTSRLEARVLKLEQTFISCFEYKSMYVNGELYLCNPQNTYLRKEQFHEFYTQ
jgi:hypothetical protein